jgi:predicted PurR-regulated permease PerM
MASPGHTLATGSEAGPHRLLSTILLAGLTLAVGYAFVLVMRPFLVGLVWASALAIAVHPLFRRLRRWFAPAPAALITAATVTFTLIAPAALFVVGLATECIRLADRLVAVQPETRLQAVQSATQFWTGVQQRLPMLRGLDPIESLRANALDISKKVASAAGGVAHEFLAFVALGLFVMLALFFLLKEGPELVAFLRRLSPLDADATGRLFEEIRSLTASSVTATLLIAIVQGALGGIATAVLGFNSPLIWGAAFGFCSLVPVIGSALVWIPAVLWLVVAGQYGKAVAMLLVSLLIIAQTDNVIRPALVSGKSRLNFEMSMLSVLGGIAAFGMLGMILGPVIVAIFTALVDLYLTSKGPAALPIERTLSAD